MIQGTKIYKVSIVDGNIDNHRASDYKTIVENGFPNEGNVDEYKNKAKALVRFDKVAYALQKGLDTMCEIVTTGDDYNIVASQIDFTLVYTQPDGLWVEVDSATDGAEQLRDGRYIVKGIDAIKELIKNACKESYETIVEYWQPKMNKDGSDEGNVNAHNQGVSYGWAFEKMIIDGTTPNITVEEVSEFNTDLTLIKE